jgi:hypothetical protein
MLKKIIESIYGMQYEELVQNGKDGNKARFNGNIFVAAYIMVFLFLIIIACTHVSEYNDAMNGFLRRTFGVWNGPGLGKILAIPLIAVLYFAVSITIGSESAFRKYVDTYAQYSEEDKKKSVKIVLAPFMIMLALMLVLALI